MNARRFYPSLLLAACVAAMGVASATAAVGTADTKAPATKAGAAKGADAKPVDPFEPIRLRIDQLLKARVNPEPLPAPLPNPFTLPNALNALAIDDDLAPADPQAAPVVPEGPEPGSDLESLVRFAATLRVGGIIALNGQTSLYINQLLYKEGDVILMEKRDPKSAVKVLRIAPGVLTLGYKDVQHTVRLKS